MLSGGDDGGRTHGLFVANEALSQLSYIPEILFYCLVDPTGVEPVTSYMPCKRSAK